MMQWQPWKENCISMGSNLGSDTSGMSLGYSSASASIIRTLAERTMGMSSSNLQRGVCLFALFLSSWGHRPVFPKIRLWELQH